MPQRRSRTAIRSCWEARIPTRFSVISTPDAISTPTRLWCRSLLGTIDNAFVVAPQLGIATLKDFIEASKKGSNFTSLPGVGTNLHLLGELLRDQERLNMTHVPYRAFPQLSRT